MYYQDTQASEAKKEFSDYLGLDSLDSLVFHAGGWRCELPASFVSKKPKATQSLIFV